MPLPLILASTSRYRQQMLQRLGLDFQCIAPEVDERPHPGEAPQELAARLAREKARAVAARYPDAVVIGADQVADLDGQAQGKPGSEARAIEQLRACSGRRVVFHTAVCVTHRNREDRHVDRTEVWFRELPEREVEAYVRRDQPLDSAGAFRYEGLGIALFERIDNQDPSALMGLPMIWLCAALARAGCPIL